MKFSYYIEKYYPSIGAAGICGALYLLRENRCIQFLYTGLYDDTFLTAILAAISIIFGFLLTAFSILCQSNSRPVNELHLLDRFSELVIYNKKAVKCMFYNIILTSIFLLTHDKESDFVRYDFFVAIWIYFIIYSSLLSYRFLNIFYKLI